MLNCLMLNFEEYFEAFKKVQHEHEIDRTNRKLL